MGPDGFLGRRPEAVDLCREVGLGDALVPIAARGASVWARGRLRALPEGHALGIPTRFWPTARSGIVGVRGDARPRPRRRAAPARHPRTRSATAPSARSWRASSAGGSSTPLVDPLIGGIHAGSVDDMSAAATFPPLLAAAQRTGRPHAGAARRGARPRPRRPAAVLGARRRHGVARAGAGRAACAGTRRGRPALRPGRPPRAGAGRLDRAVRRARPSRRTPWCWRRRRRRRRRCCAPTTTRRPACWTPSTTPRSSLVTFRVGADDVPLAAARHRVPRAARSPHKGREPVGRHRLHLLGPQVAAPRPRTARSCCAPRSAGSTTPAPPGGATTRSSSGPGRSWARSWASPGSPRRRSSCATRDAFPQYRVHHLLRTAGVEAALARLGGVAVAGAAYHGVGIPACIASGRAAAHALL